MTISKGRLVLILTALAIVTVTLALALWVVNGKQVSRSADRELGAFLIGIWESEVDSGLLWGSVTGTKLRWSFDPEGMFKLQRIAVGLAPKLDDALGADVALKGRWKTLGGKLHLVADDLTPWAGLFMSAGDTDVLEIRRLSPEKIEVKSIEVTNGNRTEQILRRTW